MKKIIVSFAFSCLLLSTSSLYGQLYSLESKDFRIVYLSKAYRYLVPHVAACFENAMRFHQRLYRYRPNEEVTVLLEDFSDFGHGGANTVPNDYIDIGIAPFSYVYDTIPGIDRMFWMMNHELVHIVTMDKASGRDNFFRTFFAGKVRPIKEQPISIFYNYLTNPRWNAPRWHHEGIAVFLETWMAGGLGRVLGAYDEMVFRTMIRDSSYMYDMVGLESEGTTIDFQVGVNAYLYGARFMSYLAYVYGPEKLIKWTARDDHSKAYFSSQFKNVYGISLDKAWANWVEFEKHWQERNLAQIRENPTTSFRPISKRVLGSVSRSFYDMSRQKIYSAIRYPGQVAHIAAIDIASGSVKKICDVKGAALFYVTSLAYDPDTNSLFYTTDNYGWRDLNAVDIGTGKSRLLMKDVRAGDLAFNRADRSIWGVRHYNGISTLVRIPYPYREWRQVYSFPYGEDIYDIDVSPDGALLCASLTEIDGTQRLIKMETEALLRGETGFETLFNFENSSPANFVFTPDGKSLLGSSYYSGVSNIYRYDLDRHDINILSNCETGFFRPVSVSEDSLIVFRHTGKGLQPVMVANASPEHVSAITFLGNEIAKKYPVVRGWKLTPPAKMNLDSLAAYDGKYQPLSHLRMSSLYPVVEGFKDFAAAGMRLNMEDRLGLSGLNVNASYSPDGDLPADERLHLRLNFHYWNWQVHASYNGADFYDLFGPTKSSRKGYALGLGYQRALIYDPPKTLRWDFDVTGYSGLQRLPNFQNVAAPFDKLLSLKTGLHYRFIKSSLGAVDGEKGIAWDLLSQNNVVNSRFIPKFMVNLSYGMALPLDHTSLWLRTSAGHAFGDRDDPFANFFFGAFGNNYVDYLTEKRYREYYSFPGLELNEVGAKNYLKAMVELNLPPLRFRRFGFPALYANWLRFALFSSVLTGVNSQFALRDRQTFFNAGGQIDLRLVLFSNLPSTLSVGFAAAIMENQPLSEANSELMISLKILK